MKKSRLLIAGSAISFVVFAAQPALAQGVANGDVSVESAEAIVVTGSRIARPEVDSIVPVAVVGVEEIQQDAVLNVQDLLQELPQFGVGTSRTNSNFSTSGNGAATLNLRSLGSNRTLVLVNGRRHIAGFAGSSSVDVNNIPTEFVQRIEVVTGGASSVYGSEAIAGVVNFILKDRFDGIEFRAQSNITDEGDNPRYLASMTAGGTLLDDRLSVIANLTYDRDDGLRSNKRFRSSQDCGTPLGNAAGIICGPQSYSIFSAQGQFYYNQRGTGATPVLANGGNTASFSFNPDNSVLFGQGTGFNRNAERFIATPVERYLGSFLTKFDVNDNLELFIEGTYSKVKSRSSLEPSAISIGLVPAADVTSSIQLDNPFIPAAVRAQITSLNSDASAANDVLGISTRRRFNEVFDRSNKNDRDTVRLVGGLRGNFANNWNYDLSYVYGRFEDNTASETAVKSRIGNAIDAVEIGGQIVCRSAAARAEGCAPLNLFGFGTASAAASAYVQSSVPRSLLIVNEQNVVSANISGSPFSLWAGDIGIAVGAEYRSEKALSDNDPLTNAGTNIGNLTQDLTGKFNVKEVYGELNVPLIRDSFVNYLGLTGAVRYSDYSTVGSVVSWNAGAEFEPFDGLRFRGVYARANRAPNISELFSAANETFASITDPCNGLTATNNPGVNATFPNGFGSVCRAIPAIASAVAGGGTFSYTLAQQQVINGFVGGNQNLEEEKANTITLGAVIQPSFVPGLSLSADYYDIRLTGAIATLGRQFSVQQCLQSGDPVFCSNVTRNPDGRIARVDGQLINVAKTDTRGVDLGLRYTGEVGLVAGDNFNWSLNYTRLIDYETQSSPVAPIVENLTSTALSKHRGTARAAYSANGFGLSWQMTYMSKAVSSVTFTNSNPAINSLNNIRAYVYHDVQARMDLGEEKKFSLYFGIDNLFDEQPPYLPNPPFSASITGTETQADVYDPFGRRFYAGIRFKI
jgi:outer membrane receptor protein involved in Fe transport